MMKYNFIKEYKIQVYQLLYSYLGDSQKKDD